MHTLVCVKRVPVTGGRVTLTPDARAIDTRFLGFTISPHEECGVEEAVRIREAHGGEVTVLALGPPAAEEQLRDQLAVGATQAVLLEIDEPEWDPMAVAAAIVDTVRALETEQPLDLILCGNEAADSGDYQVAVRVAHALNRPCITAVKGLEVADGRVVARREVPGGWEVFELELPAVVAVKEGLNLPRYPSLPGRLRAKRATIERLHPAHHAGGPELVRLEVPAQQRGAAESLGSGVAAGPAIVELLGRLGLLS